MTFEEAKEVVRKLDPTLRDGVWFRTAVVLVIGSRNKTYDTKALMDATGYSWDFIVPILHNLIENDVWATVRGYGKQLKVEPYDNILESDIQFWLLVLIASGEVKRQIDTKKLASELGRLGGKKGGVNRAKVLSPERRKEISLMGIAARNANAAKNKKEKNSEK